MSKAQGRLQRLAFNAARNARIFFERRDGTLRPPIELAASAVQRASMWQRWSAELYAIDRAWRGVDDEA